MTRRLAAISVNWRMNAVLADVTMQTNHLVSTLRYGENPHQQAGVYVPEGAQMGFEVLQGKPMSYNNFIDLEGAWQPLCLERPAVAIIKHTTHVDWQWRTIWKPHLSVL